MDHVVSVTLIPVNGINVKLEKDIFLGNFIDKAEDVLDELPVGSAIEILYDHVVTHSDGSFQKVIPMRYFVKQTGRGVFYKNIENHGQFHCSYLHFPQLIDHHNRYLFFHILFEDSFLLQLSNYL